MSDSVIGSSVIGGAAPPSSTPVLSAVSGTRSGSVTVRATEQGLPIGIAIEESEMRYGAAVLASKILHHCARASASARAQRRALLAQDGVPTEVLDRLGLPTPARMAAQNEADSAEDFAPTSWLKQA